MAVTVHIEVRNELRATYTMFQQLFGMIYLQPKFSFSFSFFSEWLMFQT